MANKEPFRQYTDSIPACVYRKKRVYTKKQIERIGALKILYLYRVMSIQRQHTAVVGWMDQESEHNKLQWSSKSFSRIEFIWNIGLDVSHKDFKWLTGCHKYLEMPEKADDLTMKSSGRKKDQTNVIILNEVSLLNTAYIEGYSLHFYYLTSLSGTMNRHTISPYLRFDCKRCERDDAWSGNIKETSQSVIMCELVKD